MSTLSRINFQDITVRAGKTFGQAAIAAALAIPAASLAGVHTLPAAEAIAAPVLVSGVSAVWNLLLESVGAVKAAKLEKFLIALDTAVAARLPAPVQVGVAAVIAAQPPVDGVLPVA